MTQNILKCELQCLVFVNISQMHCLSKTEEISIISSFCQFQPNALPVENFRNQYCSMSFRQCHFYPSILFFFSEQSPCFKLQVIKTRNSSSNSLVANSLQPSLPIGHWTSTVTANGYSPLGINVSCFCLMVFRPPRIRFNINV